MFLSSRTLPLWLVLIIVPAAILTGLGLGRLLFQSSQEPPVAARELREDSGVFTRPLLECEVMDDQGRKALKPFRYKAEELFKRRVAEGVLIHGSIYFRDLNNGMWFGINEGVGYRPASLLKVPVMIAWYRMAESDPALLERHIVFKRGDDLAEIQDVKPTRPLVPGGSYAVRDLIERMIVDSDNNAAQLLVEEIDKRLLDDVLHDLDVNVNPDDPDHLITTHAYSEFFRVLYNASYLNREYSEKALTLLASSRFSDGIRSGIPPGLKAATKFGEWGDRDDSEIVQSHEFGIVYYPGHPYLLGVMARGRRGAEFNALLGEVSRLIYESIEEQHRGEAKKGAVRP